MTLEERIKRHLAQRRRLTADSGSGELPSAEELYLYLTGSLSGQRADRFERRMALDADTRRLVEELRRLSDEEIERSSGSAPEEWVDRAVRTAEAGSGRCASCGRLLGASRSGRVSGSAPSRLIDAVWLAATIAAFAASFLFQRYFLQCLALALLCGVKWIVNRRQTRTQILIARALESSGEADPRHLHRGSTKL